MELDKPVPKSVAIIGIGASNYDYILAVCKWGSRRSVADEVWAINKMGACIQCDMVWRMDDLKTEFSMNQKTVPTTNGEEKVQDIWYETLKKLDVPLMTCQSYPEFPTSVTYPLEEVINFLNFSYINTTPAYALAYALYLGVQEIRSYGIDFSYPNRHESEKGRGCYEFILGIAHSMGVKIFNAQHTTLLDTNVPIEKRMYGYPHPIEVKPGPPGGKRYVINPRPDVTEKNRKKAESEERRLLNVMLKKYKPHLLDAPSGAGQADSLKGDSECPPPNDTPRELQT